jgi:hypothetical protein
MSKNYYFNKETQNKIQEYQEAESKTEKDQIYVEYIMPAFDELVTKLISVYKYNASNEDMTHLKNDCITFLFETIRKWDASKGKKAFSYFNVVAKNWLTIQTRRINKNARRSVNIDESNDMTLQERECLTLIDIDYRSSPEDILHTNQINGTIITELNKLICLLSKENDKKCMHAIIHIFNNVENLDFFNKRAVFIYLREISGLNSAELSSSLSRIRKIWKKNNLNVSFFF